MSISRIVFSIISALIFTSCASEYRIEGSSSVSRLDGKMLFVKVPQGETMISVDSAEVVHGLFQMEGAVDSTMIASLYMDDQSVMPLVIEKGNIQIQIENTRIATCLPLKKMRIKGFSCSTATSFARSSSFVRSTVRVFPPFLYPDGSKISPSDE